MSRPCSELSFLTAPWPGTPWEPRERGEGDGFQRPWLRPYLIRRCWCGHRPDSIMSLPDIFIHSISQAKHVRRDEVWSQEDFSFKASVLIGLKYSPPPHPSILSRSKSGKYFPVKFVKDPKRSRKAHIQTRCLRCGREHGNGGLVRWLRRKSDFHELRGLGTQL